MNGERRIEYFTAVNIDGTKEQDVARDDFEDWWTLDPRIDESAQFDNRYYRKFQGVDNPLDRGHLVRRLDPCWGNTRSEVINAHHDTFHYTNSSPQHMTFNRNNTIWLGVENYILKKANAKNLRVCVLSGPVFRGDDPIYATPTGYDIQIPLEYWKVAAMVRPNGDLAASAYLLSQSGHIDSMIEEFVFGPYRDYQTSIRDIELKTGLSFHGLDAVDVFEGVTENVVAASRLLTSYDDIVL
jgi:endonuclease G